MKKQEISKQCGFCSDNFISTKSTAKFCSNTCRTKACVKRKQDERAKADQEAQRLLEQESLQQIADARRLKREQKAELKRQEQVDQAEIDRQAQEAKRLQDEQDAAVLAEKNRKEEEEGQKLKEKQDADEKQLLADKEAQRRIDQDQKAKKELADYNRTKAWVELTIHAIGNISNMISEKQEGVPKPHSNTQPFEKLNLGYAISPSSEYIALLVPKPREMPKLGYMSLPGINWIPIRSKPH